MTFIERAGPVRPVYIFAKPPPDVAGRIARLRRRLGIDASFGADRFHVTLLPFGEHDALSSADIARIERIVAGACAEPAPIAFHRTSGNCLRGAGLHGIKVLQQGLVLHLLSAGILLSDYTFDPHLTLAYRMPPRPAATFPPIGWLADELSLVVSHYGHGRHEELCRWTLTPRQLALAL